MALPILLEAERSLLGNIEALATEWHIYLMAVMMANRCRAFMEVKTRDFWIALDGEVAIYFQHYGISLVMDAWCKDASLLSYLTQLF